MNSNHEDASNFDAILSKAVGEIENYNAGKSSSNSNVGNVFSYTETILHIKQQQQQQVQNNQFQDQDYSDLVPDEDVVADMDTTIQAQQPTSQIQNLQAVQQQVQNNQSVAQVLANIHNHSLVNQGNKSPNCRGH
ncbi:hypothetical protein [Candidatus Deianiraea vastatrix]|uniref:Uncharacterized protein n=1 Tax=Candidatus Deianiraea vastatrix TaxID=2163644 RepID=A0A5B8XHV8_9RICK|nr:hypothetical protein [Candidatus Deianiraea vastatrix]QED23641.1 hypothetical protein Deia_00854 [Candidatus Deianiraea vastatrix]